VRHLGALDGAAELIGDELTGGLVAPTACIDGPFGGIGGVYTVTIAWRGITELDNQSDAECGLDSTDYGEDAALRRILVLRTYIAP
jgi:type IV pilus assembly protein PilV